MYITSSHNESAMLILMMSALFFLLALPVVTLCYTVQSDLCGQQPDWYQ